MASDWTKLAYRQALNRDAVPTNMGRLVFKSAPMPLLLLLICNMASCIDRDQAVLFRCFVYRF